jgi:S1-C subfamily serine protease
MIFASPLASAEGVENAHEAPANASVIGGDGWKCNKGYRKTNNICVAECKRKPTKCLRTFVKKKDYVSASDLYNKNHDLFKTSKEAKRRASELRELANYLNNDFAGKISDLQIELESMNFDAFDPSGWRAIESTISSAKQLLIKHKSHLILQEEEFRTPPASELAVQLKGILDMISNQSRSAFLSFDHAHGDSIFEIYPIAVPASNVKERRRIVMDAWPDFRPILNTMTGPEILALTDTWTSGRPRKFKTYFGSEIQAEVADSYYKIVIERLLSDEDDAFRNFKKAVDAANAFNLKPSEAITSRLLLVVTDFPGQLDVEFNLLDTYPFNITRKIPNASAVGTYDVILLFGVKKKELSERTMSTGTVNSKYKEGTTTSVNSAHVSAQSAYNSAINSYNMAQSTYNRVAADYNACQANNQICITTSYNFGVASRALSEARDRVEATQRRLRITSPTVTKPVYREYSFPSSKIRLEKKIGGVVAMITSRKSNAKIAEFSLANTKELSIAVNTHPQDSGSAKRYKTVDDLKREESEVVVVNVSDLFSNLYSSNATTRHVDDIPQFLTSTSQPERLHEAAVPVSNLTPVAAAARASHPSINSVVVVKSALGDIGAGFYVSNNMLLTNYHVVLDANYVELEFFDGRSTTGRVVNFDIDRDLALVETSISAKPLELFSGNILPLGESVTAIGHPEGLTFTITKGIISAIREQQSRSSIGIGGRYLYVQTDTAISPGNSGGPLLFQNRVIGINTLKIVGVKVEGIGFALHHTEIARYLAASMSN